ncbi:enterobactin exporter EntS [Stieleria neptunia]|uniref:Enterobactin exporter EntS n=1 Tax=Stieleria neptunia TaxID=2527979 RepID=A0A518I4E7_9BACT|nr:MFS transporter [Stieleria neptunia]QDV47974.1 enterobactin exporter EntS [Stieleria neptunia]
MEDVRNETNEFSEPYPQVVNQATGVSAQTPVVEAVRPGDRHSGSTVGGARQSLGGGGDDNGSPWLPLRNPIYRSFWIASFVSNVGTWMHEIGAGWLMTDLDASPQMVSAVRTAMATPIVLLAIPAGALADRVDRRRLLLATQVLMLLTAASLAALTAAGVMTSWLLLGLTFLIGLGLTLHVPTWQASIPELVPRPQLSRAIALGSINFNLARSAGPAIAGALVAIAGSWIAFSFNAISFAGVIVVLLMWRRQGRESSRGLSYRKSLYQGLRYVYRNHQMRHVLVRLCLFVVPASALWGLLPLVARQRLDWGADGFGVLVTCVGGGALIAARFLPVLQRRFGGDATIALAMLVFAGGLAVIASSTQRWVVVIATLVMGCGWMVTLTTLNTAAQITLPSRMRARGMSCYLTALALSMSTGSFLWGSVAESLGVGGTHDGVAAGVGDGVGTAQKIAAATLLVTAAIGMLFRVVGPTRTYSPLHRDR